MFPDDPSRFLARTPHGYHDIDTILRDVAQGGFESKAQVETIAARSRAASARVPAMAYCQGTPLRNEIVARDASGLEEATRVATDALTQRYGKGAIESLISAHVITASV